MPHNTLPSLQAPWRIGRMLIDIQSSFQCVSTRSTSCTAPLGLPHCSNMFPTQALPQYRAGCALCRTQLAYTRFWEGRSQVQIFASKLTDSVVQSVNFDIVSLPAEATEDDLEAHNRFRDTLVHLVSLLHGVGLATLREDYNMENLYVRVLLPHRQWRRWARRTRR
jgi:hypothetical protein